MTAVKSLLIAFAMFSRIPVPKVDWDERNMRHIMAALPLVGVVLGLAVLAWEWLTATLGFGPFLRGAGLALTPLLVTGGIHMDGFCDTVDALASHGDREKKLAIMKDPHLGAFAAMAVAGYLLLFAALAAETERDGAAMRCFALLFVLSRALVGLTVLLIPPARPNGLGRLFHDAARGRTNLVVLGACLLTVALLLVTWGGLCGVAALLAAFLCLVAYRRLALRSFGGVTGDLSGWFVQVCEIATVATLVVAQKAANIV